MKKRCNVNRFYTLVVVQLEKGFVALDCTSHSEMQKDVGFHMFSDKKRKK